MQSLLAIIAKYGFAIRKRPLLYHTLLRVYEQNIIVNSVRVDGWTAE